MVDVLILAGGLGTRMKSRRAKVLHQLGGAPLITYAVRTAYELRPNAILVVVGHQAEAVEQAARKELDRLAAGATDAPDIGFPLQLEQRGTGHAVMAAADHLRGRKGSIIVIAGDIPLLKSSTLAALATAHQLEKNAVTLLTVEMQDPTGYGRIVRDGSGAFERSVEQRDASPGELKIRETNVSIYCFETAALLDALDSLTTDNAQGEYYLTDVPAVIKAKGERVGLFPYHDEKEVRGVNTRIELSELERDLRESKLRELMLEGVTLIDPSTTYIERDVEIGQDTVIYPQVSIEGATRIGTGCTIQSFSRLRNATVGDDVQINNSCVIEDGVIRNGAVVGPFSRLRIGADIGEKARIGNFVEVKESKIGTGSKASHLTYLGNATVGDKVNVGAGTVTCNYDGAKKHQTIIEDGVKIGSDTMLVAPVKVGRGSVTGAGSVVTRDVPPDSLVAGVPAVVKKKLK
jgi:bifunctional UDP-N-acetylglucosamine pyrophosphorylase/glucosamine-1-phosphate N-acetyltransferase